MPPHASTLPPPADTLFQRERLGAVIGALVLISVLAFEALAVAVAMPAVVAALGGVSLYAFAFGGPLAASVLGMAWAGAACDRYGVARPTWLGFTFFAAGLLLAGVAPSMDWVVAGRVLQGLGGGMLGVALYAGMGALVPAPLHPRLFASFAAAWVLPGLLGPALAAALVAQFGWRSAFLGVLAVLPLAAALTVPAFAALRPTPAGTRVPGLDSRVAWAAAGALGALLLHAARPGAETPWLVGALGLGLLATVVAARHLLPAGSLSARPGIAAVIALRGLLAAAFASAEVFVPLHLTRDAGWGLTQAGLALTVGAVLWSVGSALQARCVAPQARQHGLRAGFALLALGLLLVALPALAGVPAGVLIGGWALSGLGIGLAFPMLSVLTLSLSAAHERGQHAAALQLSDALCSSAALALAGVLFGAAGGPAGFALVIGLAFVLALGGALIAPRAFCTAAPHRG